MTIAFARTSAEVTTLIRLCKAESVILGGVRQIELAEYPEPLALFNIGGQFRLIEDTCTHGFASLSQGDLEGDVIFCPLHGGAFNTATGEPVEYPCTVAVKTFRVWREGDDIVTDLSTGPQPEAEIAGRPDNGER
jgi:nitrite reductase/ring-hydroxylating ferredoxin subunit